MDILSYTLGKKAGGGTPVSLQDKEVEITQNGEQTITADTGYDGLSSVEVTTNVPQPSGKITITQNGTDIDVSSYATADVNVPAGITPTGTINITTNGTHDVTTYASASVSVPSQKYAPKWVRFGGSNTNYAYQGNNLDYEVANLDTSNITNMRSMFERCGNLTSLNLNEWNMSNVTNTSYMFNQCSNLTTLNISGWNTSSLSDASYMFYNTQKLSTLNISGWNTPSLTNTSYMFYLCKALTSLDLSDWNTSNVTNMTQMFMLSNNLTTINLSSFDISKVTNVSFMFSGCSSLTHLDIRNMVFSTKTGTFNTASMLDSVPTSCEIIVKDANEKAWFNTNFSSYTNVKTVAEYEAQ